MPADTCGGVLRETRDQRASPSCFWRNRASRPDGRTSPARSAGSMGSLSFPSSRILLRRRTRHLYGTWRARPLIAGPILSTARKWTSRPADANFTLPCSAIPTPNSIDRNPRNASGCATHGACYGKHAIKHLTVNFLDECSLRSKWSIVPGKPPVTWNSRAKEPAIIRSSKFEGMFKKVAFSPARPRRRHTHPPRACRDRRLSAETRLFPWQGRKELGD